MRNILTIIHYEYKAHIMRIATWGVFAAGVFFSLLDDFPSGGNLRRLEFLTDPVYLVYRTMSLGIAGGFCPYGSVVQSVFLGLQNRGKIPDHGGAHNKSTIYFWKNLGGIFLYRYSIVAVSGCKCPGILSCRSVSGVGREPSSGNCENNHNMCTACKCLYQFPVRESARMDRRAPVLRNGRCIVHHKRVHHRIGGADAVLLYYIRGFDKADLAASKVPPCKCREHTG